MHFDIAELFARKARKYLEGIELTQQSIGEMLEKINVIIAEEDTLQDEYGKETEHGTVDIQQARWRKLIKSELGKLEKYRLPCKE